MGYKTLVKEANCQKNLQGGSQQWHNPHLTTKKTH